MSLSAEANNVNWLVSDFVEKVPGVSDAIVVSSDGLPMAKSHGVDRDTADRFAAVASGLIGLAYGAAGPLRRRRGQRGHHGDGALPSCS